MYVLYVICGADAGFWLCVDYALFMVMYIAISAFFYQIYYRIPRFNIVFSRKVTTGFVNLILY